MPGSLVHLPIGFYCARSHFDCSVFQKMLTKCRLSKLNIAEHRPLNSQQIGIKPSKMVEAAGVEPASAGSPLLALHA